MKSSTTYAIAGITIATGAALAVRWLLSPNHDRQITSQVEKRAVALIREFESDAIDDEGGEGEVVPKGEVRVKLVVGGAANPKKQSFERSRMVRTAAAHVRAKVGLMKRTAANVMVARKLVQEFLDGVTDLRKAHYIAIVPYAVELAFVPTIYDIEAADFAGTSDWSERRESLAADRVVWVGRGPFGLFGRREVRTRPPTN